MNLKNCSIKTENQFVFLFFLDLPKFELKHLITRPRRVSQSIAEYLRTRENFEKRTFLRHTKKPKKLNWFSLLDFFFRKWSAARNVFLSEGSIEEFRWLMRTGNVKWPAILCLTLLFDLVFFKAAQCTGHSIRSAANSNMLEHLQMLKFYSL